MIDDDLHDLLGDAYDTTTDEQRAAITAAAARVDARWHEDLVDERREALTGALMMILGDAQPGELVADWRAARDAETAARARMTGALIVQAGSGRAEVAIAAEHGLARDTVRKALGKSR